MQEWREPAQSLETFSISCTLHRYEAEGDRNSSSRVAAVGHLLDRLVILFRVHCITLFHDQITSGTKLRNHRCNHSPRQYHTIDATSIEDFIIVTLLSISVGLKIGWTSPYLAQLTKEDSPLRITDDEATWIVSLLPFGRLFGAMVGYLAMEYYGSKRSLLISGIPIMISWICIILADSAVWLYVSRLCAGKSSLSDLPMRPSFLQFSQVCASACSTAASPCTWARWRPLKFVARW